MTHHEQTSISLKLVFAFGAIYLIWGSTYLAIRYALEAIPPFLMMGTRSATAGLILYLLGRARGRGQIERQHWPALILIGTSFFLLGHGLLAWGQQQVPSGLASVLVASEPLWIVTVESLVLRDSRVRWKGVAGLILGFAGIVYLVLSTKGLNATTGALTSSLAILFGTFSWGCGAVYSRVAKLPSSAAIAAGTELLIGSVLLLVVGSLLGETSRLQVGAIPLRSLLSLGYLILFGSVITFSAYVWLLGVTSATRVSTHTYVNPVIAILLGWLVAGEPLTTDTFFAASAIVVSVYLVLHDQSRVRPTLTPKRVQ